MKYTGKHLDQLDRVGFGMKNIFMSKWLSEDTATCNVIVQRKKIIKFSSLRCVHPEEDITHVL